MNTYLIMPDPMLDVLQVQGKAYGTAEANFYLEKATDDELVDFKRGRNDLLNEWEDRA